MNACSPGRATTGAPTGEGPRCKPWLMFDSDVAFAASIDMLLIEDLVDDVYGVVGSAGSPIKKNLFVEHHSRWA